MKTHSQENKNEDKLLNNNYITLFDERINDLDKLVETPNLIKQYALETLKTLAKSQNLCHSDQITINNGIQTLNNIQDNSIRNNYRIIYAQLCVLATSVLEALLKDYFSDTISKVENLNLDNKRLGKIRLTALDLVNNKLNYIEAFPKLILEKEKNDFQNLKKLKELFKDYLNKEINLHDDTEKMIIFYLECRHVIVHKGSVVDQNFIRNVTSYKKSNLKKYKLHDLINLDETDWNNIKKSYRELVEIATISIP